MKITQYTLESTKITNQISIACVSDLHGRDPHKVISALTKMSPDLILLAGDIFEVANIYMEKRNENSINFIREIKNIAPVYYCFGNHEIYYSHANKRVNRIPEKSMQKKIIDDIQRCNIHLINDSFESVVCKENALYIGGITCGSDTDPESNINEPNLSVVSRLDDRSNFKILLCHYPHYYEKYLKNTDIDLILSGHAHGGQWRIFGRGVYAPHQGIFPKFTSGIHDGRHIINRGAVNNSKPIPRFFNPPEIVEIILNTQTGKTR